MEQLGIRVIAQLRWTARSIDATSICRPVRLAWSCATRPELISVVQNTAQLAADRPAAPAGHHRAPARTAQLDLLPFEQEMVDIVNKFIASSDDAERVELMKQYQKVSTDERRYGSA